MSLKIIDYTQPISLDVIARHAVTGEYRLIKADVLWEHIIGVEEEPFPEQFYSLPKARELGVTSVRLVWGQYSCIGPLVNYQISWRGYKAWKKKQDGLLRFYLPQQ